MVITDYGVGRQSLETVHQKLVLDSVNIVNSGSWYAYKRELQQQQELILLQILLPLTIMDINLVKL